MKSMIHIQKLTYEPLFSNLNLEIKKGSFLSIVGKNGCGKSVLVRMLLGLIDTNNEIEIDGLFVNKQNKKEILKKIGVVFENPDTNFVAETPKEDMMMLLQNNGYSITNIKDRIEEISKLFEIEDLLDISISNLSGGEKQILALATVYLTHPSILILDDAFAMLDGIVKDKILKLIKKLNREKKVTIIQITHDMDDLLYGNEVAVIDNQQIILKGKKEVVLKEEKIFKNAGLELPFMASLSLKLQFYGLIDHMILDMDKMVNALWK